MHSHLTHVRNTIFDHAYEQWRKQAPKISQRIIHIEIGNEAYAGTQTHRCLLNKYIFSTYTTYISWLSRLRLFLPPVLLS